MATPTSNSEQVVVNITGDNIVLGPLRRELLHLNTKWSNEFAITSVTGFPLRPTTQETWEEWYQHAIGDNDTVHFTIYERLTMRPIGGTELNHINRSHRTAEFSILIGERECWGKGYGTEATRLVLDYGFSCLELHNICLKVYGFNERALRTYTRAGFKIIGQRRESYRLAGNTYDEVYMDCLASEFVSPVLKALIHQ